MINKEKVIQSIFEAIDEINEQLPRDKRLGKSINTALFGNDGNLDSLGLISLITSLEQKIEENLGITVTILEKMEDIEDKNPFETVKSLTDYLSFFLENKSNE
ncbi:MAG: hypothetical protein QXT99_08915 [Candidatus Nitrosotenuis sp.]